MIRLATRKSRLAVLQAREVQDLLFRLGIESKLVYVTSEGDRKRSLPLPALGGGGAFIRALEELVLEGGADAAVHSLKDVPTEGREEWELAAVLPRPSSSDSLVAPFPLSQLPPGSTVGTSSLRRRAQLLRRRSDLRVVEIRGNVPTRLSKIGRGVDGVCLSEAGLLRLGVEVEREVFNPKEFPHAPGQGAVAVVVPRGSPLLPLLRKIDDPRTRRETEVERGTLRDLGGGCLAPVAVAAWHEGTRIHAKGEVLTPDGSKWVEAEVEGADDRPTELARTLSQKLRERGADLLLQESRSSLQGASP